jgi:hypothetical protein
LQVTFWHAARTKVLLAAQHLWHPTTTLLNITATEIKIWTQQFFKIILIFLLILEREDENVMFVNIKRIYCFLAKYECNQKTDKWTSLVCKQLQYTALFRDMFWGYIFNISYSPLIW